MIVMTQEDDSADAAWIAVGVVWIVADVVGGCSGECSGCDQIDPLGTK